MNRKTLRLLVVDDHDVVRAGVRMLLARHHGFEICGEASNGLDAVQKAESLKPDVAVVDIRMPDLDGLEVTRRIRKISPQTEVVILTMYDSGHLVGEAIRAGARCYVLKTAVGRDLAAAVESAQKQKRFVSPGIPSSENASE